MFCKKICGKRVICKSTWYRYIERYQFKELEVKNNKYGKPDIKVICNSKKIVKKILKNKKYNVLLSLSDDKPFAMAKVIIVIK